MYKKFASRTKYNNQQITGVLNNGGYFCFVAAVVVLLKTHCQGLAFLFNSENELLGSFRKPSHHAGGRKDKHDWEQ